MAEYVELKNINKAFPGVRALKDIDLRVEGGMVTALIGENGAGKSTLLKVLSGEIRPDTGTIDISGEIHHFTHPKEAIDAGVSVIYQERQLVPMMSVMENIYIDDMPTNKVGLIDRRTLRAKAKEIIEKFGLDIDPDEPVGRLSVAYQQMVEIMKAYRRDSRVICFDEPTAPLMDNEIETLFRIIRELRDQGKVVLYVSHRMGEIFQITDRLFIMKDGAMVTSLVTAETSESEVVKLMVGRDVGDTYKNLVRNDKIGPVLLEVNDLNTESVQNITFQLHEGEVLGFAGLVGAGRTEVMRALFGDDKILSGTIKLGGEEVSFKSPREAIDAGIMLCPEDRKEEGLILPRSISDNISAPVLAKLKHGLFMDRAAETNLAQAGRDKYNIKTPTLGKRTIELSGGNQQKVILARWTSEKLNTRVLILDEPTKGIDVGTKAEVYQMVCDLAREGKGVIFISSELTEVLNVADRIIVMHDGHITGEVMREDATEENVLALAMKE